MVRPKKHLGQHFLTDPSIAARIAGALETRPGDLVVEVGPGKGILTAELMKRGNRLIPVEVDPESSGYLKKRWPGLSDTLIEDDILQVNLESLGPGPLHIIGNFPYNLSSQIFFRVLDYRHRVEQVVCMLQKEVADRIAAPAGNREYGILSVLLQAFFDIETLFRVKPGSFFPPPKVHSAVIRLKRNGRSALPCDESLFFRLVKLSFQQRRKMIRNSIQSIFLHLDSSSGLLSKRPEQLDVEDFIALTNWAESQSIQSP